MNVFVRGFVKSTSLLLLAVLTIGTAHLQARAQAAPGQIRLNQIGFYPEAPKVAAVVDAPAGVFHVLAADLADTVFTGTLGAEKTWAPAGEVVRKADFSAFQGEGEFVVHVPGVGSSYPFRIAQYVHQEVARAALRGFYYQRASTALPQAHAGRWARAAGHADTRVLVHPSAASDTRLAGTAIAAPRGWYDAGDYNKYIVNSGITTGTLLMLYEHFPEYFSALDLNIPESGNGVPDLLDEILWNLRWMLAMQDPDDGGVYTKLTAPNFEGMVMPAQARQQRYVVQKSTAAALDFAAVTALAARIYAGFETELPGLADSSLAAARAAWNWALQHPNVAYDQNAMNRDFNPDINTGGYGDASFGDEFRWAAAELYLTTGERDYIDRYSPFGEPSYLATPGWPNVGTMAFFSLAHHRDGLGAAVNPAEVRRRLVTVADGLVDTRSASPYDMVMGRTAGEFFWGSNSYAATQGVLLVQAYRLTGDTRYLDAALSNLDYLLGRNGTGYSFLTGYGDKTPLHIHHRPSEADAVADPVPGLLAGGPNAGREDQGSCPAYPSTLAAKAYIDHTCSYASNEIAINWNAPLAYLSGAVEALLSPTGLPVATRSEAAPVRGRGGLELASYPNPASTEAVVTFAVPAPGAATLTLYDLLGRAVAYPLREAFLSAGRHRATVDVRHLSPGAYLLRLQMGRAAETQLVVVAR